MPGLARVRPVPAPRAWRSWLGLVTVAASAATLWAAPAPAARATEDRVILHVLNRTGYGPRRGDVERVRAQGLAAYLDGQLHPERLSDDALRGRLGAWPTLDMSTADIVAGYARPLFASREAARRASRQAPGAEPVAGSTASPALRREAGRPARELAEQKVVRAVLSERQLEEVLVDFWFNHFNVDARKGLDRFFLTAYERDVIRPHVLGRFRDLLGATAKSPAMLFYLDNWMSVGTDTLRGRRRGLNENYGRELLELHTLGVDGGYTQADVTAVARAFTGWTFRRESGDFAFDARLHDAGAKTVLGHAIAAGGMRDGEAVLDLLAGHPATARFIATKLVRRFVSDDPPGSLVDRVAARFTATGGDLREVMRAILTSPEFMSPDVFGGKTKTPFEFVVTALRATGAPLAGPVAPGAVVRQLQELGMPLYQCQPPTGYRDTADAWTNTGSLIGRMNVAQAMAARLASDAPVPGPDLVGPLSPTTAATIARAANAAERLALTLGSPDFQKR